MTEIIRLRVTAEKAVFYKSDDEGPNNDADMQYMWVYVRGWNSKKGNIIALPGNPYKTYEWGAGEKTIVVGYTWNYNASTELDFYNGGSYDINQAQLKLSVYGEETDNIGEDEKAWGHLKLVGKNNMLGSHVVKCESDDFGFKAHFTVEEIPFE
ncbi:MAG: hypothetical protein F6K23_02925 [Okeania sp. SIO2C9]|uniref:hypothetical protein n=1 Tax=Okeania sp. SIO2C9 TaxID=2607791 RepID=UPI0013C20608|nr:hypothetical protein [Okeania sp. SIO2C9]NEQ72118.1 hypothetical protein [Okeania sp. SIO2C9]